MDLGCARFVEASVRVEACRRPLTFGRETFSTRIRSEKDTERKMHRVGCQYVRDNNAWISCVLDGQDHGRYARSSDCTYNYLVT